MELGRVSFQPLCQALVGAWGAGPCLTGRLQAGQKVEPEAGCRGLGEGVAVTLGVRARVMDSGSQMTGQGAVSPWAGSAQRVQGAAQLGPGEGSGRAPEAETGGRQDGFAGWIVKASWS